MIQTFEAVVVKTVVFGVGMDKLTNTEEQAWKQTHAELWYKTEVTCLISWVKTDHCTVKGAGEIHLEKD